MATKHQIHWDNEGQTVVLQSYHHDATSHDMYEMAVESAEMLNSVDHTVHLIIDESAINKLFVIGSHLMKHLEQNVPSNQGAVLVVGAHQYAKAMDQIGEKVAPKAFHQTRHFESIDAAREFLVEQFGVSYP